MEDFLKFLLIAGVIVIAIVKEAKKNKAKKAKEMRPAPTMQQPARKTPPDTPPMPETWRGKMLEELLQPILVEQPAAPPPPSKKKKEISVESSLANSAAQDKRNSKEGAHYDMPSQGNQQEEQDYTIHSAEEARRAIIWGEILQRKY